MENSSACASPTPPRSTSDRCGDDAVAASPAAAFRPTRRRSPSGCPFPHSPRSDHMSNRRARRPMRIVDGVPVIRTEPDDPDTISALAVPTAYRRPATVEELLWLVAAGYEVTGRVEAAVTVDGGLRWRNLHKTG